MDRYIADSLSAMFFRNILSLNKFFSLSWCRYSNRYTNVHRVEVLPGLRLRLLRLLRQLAARLLRLEDGMPRLILEPRFQGVVFMQDGIERLTDDRV